MRAPSVPRAYMRVFAARLRMWVATHAIDILTYIALAAAVAVAIYLLTCAVHVWRDRRLACQAADSPFCLSDLPDPVMNNERRRACLMRAHQCGRSLLGLFVADVAGSVYAYVVSASAQLLWDLWGLLVLVIIILVIVLLVLRVMSGAPFKWFF